MNVFFDVLDTLVVENGDPRPHSCEVFLELTEMGYDVYVWSSGGGGYAENVASIDHLDGLLKGADPHVIVAWVASEG